MELKTCSKCKKSKQRNEFYKDRSRKDGLRISCKKCDAETSKKWLEKNPGYLKKYYKDNLKRNKERVKEWTKNNPEKVRERQRIFKEKNPEYYKRYARGYMPKRRRIPKHNLTNRIATSVRQSLKLNISGRSWEKLVGYTMQDLRKHLENQFEPGMNWGNMGKWHIDHIIPLNNFSFISYKDSGFKTYWSLENLQPLWAFDNYSKGGRMGTLKK